jgi:UDP-N-acetylmuramoyl-tripeptide--D-alanyl-D-alanine ligase
MDTTGLYTIFQNHPIICTDSRKVTEGCLFFALKGDNFDGNKFAASALADGAAYAVVDDPAFDGLERCILVDDVLQSLQSLATYHRSKLNIPVLAITGSNGKTTTKELSRDVISKKFATVATQGNLNNHIGVPLTILNTELDTEFLIVEMGANHQGEIDHLCHIAIPDYVMITNIGKAHLEGFGGEEGVKKGKSEMYRFAAQQGAKVFVNEDDPVLMALIPDGTETIPYSPAKLLDIISEEPFIQFKYKNELIKTHLYGAYNQTNIAFALAMGEYFGVTASEMAEAISSYMPENNRSQMIRIGSNTYVKDAYNANPSSMKVSIESFARLTAAAKVLILGDMLELGNHASDEHTKIIQLTKHLGFEEVLFIGPIFEAVQDPVHGKYFKNVEAAKKYVDVRKYQNATILLKGSRGIAVEKLLE